MKKTVISIAMIISIFNPLTNQETLLAINKHRQIKIATGATTGICSLVVWHYLNKKIDKLERLESILKKARGRDEDAVKHIKRLVSYKYLSLFVALVSFGYVSKQILNLCKNNIEKERVITKDYELKFKSGDSWFSYEIWEYSDDNSNDCLISHELQKTKMPKTLEKAYQQAWNKSFASKKDLSTSELRTFFHRELDSIIEQESLKEPKKSSFLHSVFF